MKREVRFKPLAFEQFYSITQSNPKLANRITRILTECVRTPFEGIGKPEPLKGNRQGFWSRRVDNEDRIVYEITDDAVIVYSLLGHYE